MGKRKMDQIEVIQNNTKKSITFCKRKKGLIKKAIQLSVLCDVQIYMAIFDSEK